MDIYFRIAAQNDIQKMSKQLTISYVSAYKGLMSEEYLSSLHFDYWVPILEASMQNGDNCFVVEKNNRIVGSSVYGIAHENEKIYAEWHAFYLLPQYISQGIGHSFYQKIEVEMRRMGCVCCILEVLSTNKRAINFYLSHGFVKVSTFTVEENGMILSCDRMIKTFQ